MQLQMAKVSPEWRVVIWWTQPRASHFSIRAFASATDTGLPLPVRLNMSPTWPMKMQSPSSRSPLPSPIMRRTRRHWQGVMLMWPSLSSRNLLTRSWSICCVPAGMALSMGMTRMMPAPMGVLGACSIWLVVAC